MGSMKYILAAAILACLAAPAAPRADATLPTITKIRAVRSGDRLGIEISADRKLDFTCYKMAQFYRVVIDFPRTLPGRPDTRYRVGTGLIDTVEVERKTINDVPLTRVNLNLTGDAEFTALADPEDKNRVTVYVRPAAPAAVNTPVKTSPLSSPVPAPAQPATGHVAPKAGQPATIDRITFGENAIDIHADGPVGPSRVFTLRTPGRLVIDIPSARSTLGPVAVPANRYGITAVRTGVFEGNLRVVFASGGGSFPGCRVETTGSGLRIVPARQ